MQRPLGLGDVVMLSPIFEAYETYITKKFVTDLPVFLELTGWELRRKVVCHNGLLIVPSFTFSDLTVILRWRGPLFVNFSNRLYFYSEGLVQRNDNSGHYIANLEPLLGECISYPLLRIEKSSHKYDIVCFPFVNWESRQWPKTRWIKLLSMLAERYSVAVLGGDSVEEKEWNSSFDEIAGLTNLTGKIRLNDSLDIISKSKIVVCQDSGPFHFSYMARGPKVVVLFGVTRSDSRLPLDPSLRENIFVLQDTSCAFHSCYNGLKEPSCHNEFKFQCIKKTEIQSVYRIITKNIETCVE